MKRLAVLLVLVAALALPLAAAYGGGSTAKSTPVPAVEKPVGAPGDGECPYGSSDAPV